MLPCDTDALPDWDDQALARDAATNPDAWDALYRRYVQRVYHYVRLHAANIHDQDAADVTQQIFLQAFAALSRAVVVEAFAPWLFRIAHNVVITTQQRQRRTLSWEQVSEADHPHSAQEPEQLALQHERWDHLHHLLKRLSPNQRELIVLRFAAQLSFAEIAQAVGKQPDAVKKQIYRLLQHLKEHYRDEA